MNALALRGVIALMFGAIESPGGDLGESRVDGLRAVFELRVLAKSSQPDVWVIIYAWRAQDAGYKQGR